MGWHYILKVKCRVLPEFVSFIENKYLMNMDDDDTALYNRIIFRGVYDAGSEEERGKITELQKMRAERWERMEEEYERLPKSYKDLIDIWRGLGIGSRFYEYEFSGGVFVCEISKKVVDHDSDLRADYETFLKDIIVHISSEIISCRIESDDYGCTAREYSDSELRNIRFRLEDKIKSVEHIYSEDRSEIIETRVIYKHSIRRAQLLDLDRAYGFRT